MDLNYEIGTKIIVVMPKETVIGDVKSIAPDGTMIELDDAIDLDNAYKYTCPQMLGRDTIKSIMKFRPENTDEILKATSEGKKCPAEYLNLTYDDVEEMHAIIEMVSYVFDLGEKFDDAIVYINRESAIAVHVEPVEYGRNDKIALITVATHENVFVFDIVLLGSVPPELKRVLESKQIKKIVYYGHKITDNLKHKLDIELRGIFDVYVAHCLISKKKDPISLVECANTYFNIPKTYFLCAFEEEKDDIYTRPFARIIADRLAKNVMFLYKLHDYMLHEIMLKNFYEQCREFAMVFAANKDSTEVASQMKPNVMHGTECIGSEEWKEVLDRKVDFVKPQKKD